MAVFALMIVIFTLGTPLRDPNRVQWLVATIQLKAFQQALDQYASDCGNYPSSSIGLIGLRDPVECRNWRGPYLQAEIPADPWGTPYSYSLNSRSQRPVIISFGADRVAGGEFFNADISSDKPVAKTAASPMERKTRLAMTTGFMIAIASFSLCLYLSCRLAKKRST